MKQEKRFSIDQGVVFYIQKLEYEADGLRVLLNQVFHTGELKADDRALLTKTYTDAFATFRTAFQEIINQVCPGMSGKKDCFNLNYATDELVVTWEE